MADGRTRREPVFDARADRSALDLRLSREDRAGGVMAKPRRAGSDKKRGGGKAPRGRKRRSILARLVYGTVVLGIWGVIALAGLIAYHAAQLPPIDQRWLPVLGPAPGCPVHGLAWRTIPAGVSKRTGRPYSSFESCPAAGCDERPAPTRRPA